MQIGISTLGGAAKVWATLNDARMAATGFQVPAIESTLAGLILIAE